MSLDVLGNLYKNSLTTTTTTNKDDDKFNDDDDNNFIYDMEINATTMFSSDGILQLPDACRFDHLPDPDEKVNANLLITDAQGGNARTFENNETIGWHCVDNYCVSKLLRSSARTL